MSPLDTSRISGLTSLDSLTWVKPSRRAMAADALLVLRVAVAVHEDDGGGTEPVGVGRAERLLGCLLVERADEVAVGADPFADLDHPVVELLGEHDVAVEDARPGLVADAQRVAEPLGDHQDGRLALALEQRVGRDGGAEPHGADLVGGQRGSPGARPSRCLIPATDASR